MKTSAPYFNPSMLCQERIGHKSWVRVMPLHDKLPVIFPECATIDIVVRKIIIIEINKIKY
jgi:hypothetical protein